MSKRLDYFDVPAPYSRASCPLLRCDWLYRRTARGKTHEEGRARAVDALDGQVAAHQVAEVAADRQPEAGPAVPAPGRCLGLGERLEQPPELLFGHPDAG